MKKSIIIRYIILILVVGLLSGLLYYVASRNKTKGYVTPPPAIEIAKPIYTTISQSITLSGYIEARSMIPVVPLVSGIITEYPVKTGQLVKKGEILAKIDEAPFLQQMYQSRAAYLGYQSTFERVESLYNTKSTTKQNYESAKAQRDAALAQYELAQLQLSYAKVTSPVKGTVLSAPSAKGNVGTSTQPVAIIADLNDLVVRLNVPEKYFTLFSENRKNMSAIVIKSGIEGLSDDKTCTTVIDNVAPYIQSDSKTFQTVFALKGDVSSFKPGMYIQVKVTYQIQENVPALPLDVLKIDGSCYIYNSEMNKVEWTTFTVDAKDDKYFMVPANYADSDFVISGQNTVFDGQTIGKVTPIQLEDLSLQGR